MATTTLKVPAKLLKHSTILLSASELMTLKLDSKGYYKIPIPTDQYEAVIEMIIHELKGKGIDTHNTGTYLYIDSELPKSRGSSQGSPKGSKSPRNSRSPRAKSVREHRFSRGEAEAIEKAGLLDITELDNVKNPMKFNDDGSISIIAPMNVIDRIEEGIKEYKETKKRNVTLKDYEDKVKERVSDELHKPISGQLLKAVHDWSREKHGRLNALVTASTIVAHYKDFIRNVIKTIEGRVGRYTHGHEAEIEDYVDKYYSKDANPAKVAHDYIAAHLDYVKRWPLLKTKKSKTQKSKKAPKKGKSWSRIKKRSLGSLGSYGKRMFGISPLLAIAKQSSSKYSSKNSSKSSSKSSSKHSSPPSPRGNFDDAKPLFTEDEYAAYNGEEFFDALDTGDKEALKEILLKADPERIKADIGGENASNLNDEQKKILQEVIESDPKLKTKYGWFLELLMKIWNTLKSWFSFGGIST